MCVSIPTAQPPPVSVALGRSAAAAAAAGIADLATGGAETGAAAVIAAAATGGAEIGAAAGAGTRALETLRGASVLGWTPSLLGWAH